MIAAEPQIKGLQNLTHLLSTFSTFYCALDITKDGCQPEEINNFFASAGGVATVEAEEEMDEEAKPAEPQGA